MIRDMLIRKPGNEVAVLTETAKNGLQAIDTLVLERNALAKEVIDLRRAYDKLILDHQSLVTAHGAAMEQRDFWMRANARVETHLSQIGTALQALYNELRKAPDNNDKIKQLAERFAPEAGVQKNVKSVG
jgi:hypothetical protein